jgi:hypothetical protein
MDLVSEQRSSIPVGKCICLTNLFSEDDFGYIGQSSSFSWIMLLEDRTDINLLA